VLGRVTALFLLVGVGAIVAASPAFASPSNRSGAKSGDIGIRLVAVPGVSLATPLASVYVVDHLAPGMRLTRTVQIDNDSGTMVEVSVYPSAASIVAGTFAFAPGHSRNELSRWTSVTHATLRLAPHTEAFDMLTVNVPRNASSGDRDAVVWAEVSAPPTAGAGITLVSRAGVRMYLSIGPGGAPASNFEIGSLTAKRSAAGGALVVASVRNNGQSTLDLSGNLRLSKGPRGLRAGPFAATLGAVLAPGVAEAVTVNLGSEFPRGPWRADLGLTSGTLQRSSVATVTFPLSSPAVKASRGAAVLALIFVVIVLLIVLAITGGALLVSRRRNAQQP